MCGILIHRNIRILKVSVIQFSKKEVFNISVGCHLDCLHICIVSLPVVVILEGFSSSNMVLFFMHQLCHLRRVLFHM